MPLLCPPGLLSAAERESEEAEEDRVESLFVTTHTVVEILLTKKIVVNTYCHTKGRSHCTSDYSVESS